MGTEYPDALCPERPRLVKGAAEPQVKYLPELQAERQVGYAACERYKRRSVTLLWGVHS